MTTDLVRCLAAVAKVPAQERVRVVQELARDEKVAEYLDLVGTCHSYLATLGRLVPRLRGQEFTDDERDTVRR